MTIATGVQVTVETNWIGDLVPQNLRAWFTSVKSVVSLIGMISLGLFFGWIIDNYGKGEDLCITSMWLYLLVAFSHIMAIALIWKVPDRKPQPVGIFSRLRGQAADWHRTQNHCRGQAEIPKPVSGDP